MSVILNRFMNDISVHGCEPEEIMRIAEKYDLEYKSGENATWITLKVPEANTKITWFRKKSEV